MKIKKSILKKALETVKPGLANNTVIEQATNFCFINDTVVTYNDEISIRHPLEIELEGAVNATELYGFVNKVSADEIDLEIEGSELILKAGKSKAGLALQAEIVLPIAEIGEIKKWHKIPKGFWKAVNFARASCSTDMSRPILTCIHVDGNVVEGTDNLRIARTELDDEIGIKEFLLPARIAGTIAKLHPMEIAEGDNWIHFRTKDGAMVSCRVFEDDEKYVDTAKVWGMKGDEIEFPEQMMDILEKAEIFAKREHSLDEAVTIDLQNKRLLVSSKSETGWFEEKGKVTYTGEPIIFSITLFLLRDILNETNTAVINTNKLLFEGANWKYLTLLRD